MNRSTIDSHARRAIAAALLLSPLGLRAQAPPPATELSGGTRLRVLPRAAARSYLARLVRATRDTAWVRAWAADTLSADGAFAVPLASLRRLEYSRGTARHVGRNTLYGAAAGALIGGAIGAAAGQGDDGDILEVSAGEAAVFVGAVFALPGALVGALSGTRQTEDWAPVALPAPSRPASAGPSVRPRLGLARVPVRGAPPARALTLGITVRTR
jgi:hypothetical protein